MENSASIESLDPVELPDDVGQDVTVDTETDFELDTEIQVQDAVSALQDIPELEPDSWSALDADQRLETLQNIEDKMAEIQGRPSVEIKTAEMENSVFGGFDGSAITINTNHLTSDMPVQEFMNTVIHEGRHAYQDYAIKNPGIVTDAATVTAWSENMENYFSAELYGQEIYASQPVEADAWNYADRITNALIANNVTE